jgi:hypothetical protein
MAERSTTVVMEGSFAYKRNAMKPSGRGAGDIGVGDWVGTTGAVV